MIGSASSIGNTPGKESSRAGDEYRRRARRLRGLYGDRPVVLQRRLKELSALQEEVKEARNPSLMGGSTVAREFAERVEGEIQGGVLRYSQRQALIKAGLGQGIQRFEANLIIAVVEHRVRGNAGQRDAFKSEERGRMGWAAPMVVAGAIQAAIVVLVYCAS